MRLALIAHRQAMRSTPQQVRRATAPAAQTKPSPPAKTHGPTPTKPRRRKACSAAKALRMATVAYKLAMPKMDSLPTIRAQSPASRRASSLKCSTAATARNCSTPRRLRSPSSSRKEPNSQHPPPPPTARAGPHRGKAETWGPLVRQPAPAARLARILSHSAQELWDTCTVTDADQMHEDARAIASRILAACPSD